MQFSSRRTADVTSSRRHCTYGCVSSANAWKLTTPCHLHILQHIPRDQNSRNENYSLYTCTLRLRSHTTRLLSCRMLVSSVSFSVCCSFIFSLLFLVTRIFDYMNIIWTWLQFPFVVKANVVKMQISKFYPHILSPEASYHTNQSPIIINIRLKANFCARLFVCIQIWWTSA